MIAPWTLNKSRENSTSFHITHVNRDNLETQLNTLLKLWQLRFGIKSEQMSYTRRDTEAQTTIFSKRYLTEAPERLSWLKEYGPAYFDR